MNRSWGVLLAVGALLTLTSCVEPAWDETERAEAQIEEQEAQEDPVEECSTEPGAGFSEARVEYTGSEAQVTWTGVSAGAERAVDVLFTSGEDVAWGVSLREGDVVGRIHDQANAEVGDEPVEFGHIRWEGDTVFAGVPITRLEGVEPGGDWTAGVSVDGADRGTCASG